jgi:hypothetical protein
MSDPTVDGIFLGRLARRIITEQLNMADHGPDGLRVSYSNDSQAQAHCGNVTLYMCDHGATRHRKALARNMAAAQSRGEGMMPGEHVFASGNYKRDGDLSFSWRVADWYATAYTP